MASTSSQGPLTTCDSGSPPVASKSDSPLAANIRYGYSQGWSFTPLDGKRPIRKRWQSAPRETLDEALGWAAEGNVGLRTGTVSGIVVIDVDPGGDIEPLGLPGTAAAATGRPQAFHLYYRSDRPLRNSSKKLGPHIDVKADGGQVVFPGSVHPDTGAVYAWVEGYEPWNVEIAELPAHIVELLCSDEAKAAPVRPAALKTTAEPHCGPSPTEDGLKDRPDAKTLRYAQRALQLELHNLCQATDGTRNQTLNCAAFGLGRLVGGGYLDRTEVEAALRSAAGSIGLDAHEIEATIRSGLDSGIAQPRSVEVHGRPARQVDPDFDPAEYVLLPGPHKDDQDHHIEQSTADFAVSVLERLPADAIYRRDFIPGEIIGGPGKRKWVELSADRMRILADSHVKLGKWVTHRKTQEQVLLYQACGKDAAGRPKCPNRLGGFENWSETVGGILGVNGLRAWRTNEEGWRKAANPHGAELDSLVEAWNLTFGYAEVTPKELRELAEREDLFGYLFAKQNAAATSVAFGRMLSRHVDKPVASWFIRRDGTSNHVKYRLEDIQ